MRNVTMPYLDVPSSLWADLARLGADVDRARRYELVEVCAAKHGIDYGKVPAAWREHGPLSAWCALVLVANDIPVPDEPRPLTSFGIDLGLFPSKSIQAWVFALA